MSQENVEVLKELFALFDAGDIASWREFLAEDIIWDTSASNISNAGIYKGHKGVERFFTDWLGAWVNPKVESHELIDGGDSVVDIFRWSAREKMSGVSTEGVFFAVYDLRDRKVVRFRQYETRDEALKAAGLSE